MTREAQRAWSGPELIVIVRSAQEEAVLSACKVQNAIGLGGAYHQYDACGYAPTGTFCIACAAYSSS